jgi:hypothetical protein
MSSVAIIGTAGVAAANPLSTTKYLPNKDACNSQWGHYGFKNRGGCESYWDKHKPHQSHDNHGHGNDHHGGGGNGYGGSNSGGVAVIVNGDHNVINIVINYFFGG